MDFDVLPFRPTTTTTEDNGKPHDGKTLMAPSSSVPKVAMTTDSNKEAILCELILIMNQCNINTEDLLGFRLVSKSWRDAATFILLQRNACRIILKKQRLRVTSREDPNYKTYAMYSCRYKNSHKILDDLSSLMSTSSVFPVSTFGIVGHRSRNNKFGTYNDYSELQRFLSLHGGHVKTLRLGKSVTIQELNLYSKYLNNLECIELDDAVLCKRKCEQNNTKSPDLNDAIGHFQSITTLRIVNHGLSKRINNTEIIKFLCSSASQLKYIENLNLASLQIILENGKGHLIKEFTSNFSDEIYFSSTKKVLRTMQNFSKVCSAPDWGSSLSKINLDVVDLENEACFEIAHAISAIIMGCSDNLQELEFTYVPAVVLKQPIIIPKMPNLKSLTLNLMDYCGRDPGENSQVFQIQRESNPVDQDHFRNNVSREAMFPKLYKVHLRLHDTTKYNKSNTFLHFFKLPPLENDEAVVDKGVNCIPSVRLLKTNFICLNLADAKAISALFPNVKFVKTRLDAFYMFQNNLWAMCPLATSIEISGIFWNTNHGEKFQVEMFDQFLTGFPFEICEQMRKFEKESPLPDFCKLCEFLPFLKMLPSICDMSHLRKLKFKFGELSCQFGSQVSAVYALQKMPHLKIIASYDPAGIVAGEDQDQNPVAVVDGYLASIAPYVQIVHEEQ